MNLNSAVIDWWCQAIFWFDTIFSTEIFSLTFFILFGVLTVVAMFVGE